MKTTPLHSLVFGCAALLVTSVGEVRAQGDSWGWEPSGGRSSGGGLFGASNFKYGFVDAGYYLYDFDDSSIESASGFAGTISVPIVDSFFVKASVGFASPEAETGDDVKYLTWDLGAGVGLPIFEKLDFVIEGGMAHQRFTSRVLDNPIDGWGWYASPALRFMVGDALELNGGVTFQHVNADGEMSLDLKALLHLTPNVSLHGGVSFSEEVNRYGAGLRISF